MFPYRDSQELVPRWEHLAGMCSNSTYAGERTRRKRLPLTNNCFAWINLPNATYSLQVARTTLDRKRLRRQLRLKIVNIICGRVVVVPTFELFI